MLDPEQPTTVAPVHTHRRTWLIVALVVVLLAVVGVGVWAIAGSSSDEPEAVTVVKDYTKAMNAQDIDTMKSMSTDNFVFAILDSPTQSVVQGPLVGDAFYTFMQNEVFPLSPAWDLTSGVATTPGQASVMTHMTGEMPLTDTTGTSVFTFATIDGQLKVSSMVWLPALTS